MNITLEAGEDKTLSLVGFGFYVVQSDGPIIAELREIDGQVDQSGVLLSGQGLQGNSRFETVRVINMHTTAQTIQIYTGARAFIDNRNVGEVTVRGTVSVDPVADLVYPVFGRLIGKGATTGNMPYAEFHNPVGSGVVMHLRRAMIAASSGYGHLVKIKGPTSPTPTLAIEEVSLTKTAATSKALFDTGVDSSHYLAASVPSGGSGRIMTGIRGEEAVGDINDVVIEEGESIVFYASSGGTVIYGNLTWEERASV